MVLSDNLFGGSFVVFCNTVSSQQPHTRGIEIYLVHGVACDVRIRGGDFSCVFSVQMCKCILGVLQNGIDKGLSNFLGHKAR